MLLEFTVENYKSFYKPVTLSLVASKQKENSDTNVFQKDKYELLKSAVIYGANASGKSNLLKALQLMKRLVINSATKLKPDEPIKVEPFLLNTESKLKPSCFEIIFLIGNIRYRYGFQVNAKQVVGEWLYFIPSTKEAMLFERNSNTIKLGARFKEGRLLEPKTRENVLFLSLVAQFNGEISTNVVKWFRKVNVISGLDDVGYRNVTIDRLKNPTFKNWLVKYMQTADMDISDIETLEKKISRNDIPSEFLPLFETGDEQIKFVQRIVKTKHQLYDKMNNRIDSTTFDLLENESAGTIKFLFLAGPLWDTFLNSKILIIDEFDTRLHNKLSLGIVNLINSNRANFQNAQFIMATHDTTLLRGDIFRRDQIWFTEKDVYGVSDLFSLVEYKENNKAIRNDASYSKRYLEGRYGAVPIIDDLESLFEENKIEG